MKVNSSLSLIGTCIACIVLSITSCDPLSSTEEEESIDENTLPTGDWVNVGWERIRAESIHFINEQTGWIAGGRQDAVFHTNDGGETWNRQELNTSNHRTRDIHFVDEQTGWAAGFQGVMLHTSDGGDNWVYYDSGYSDQIHAIHFSPDETGFAVGPGGKILRYD